MGSDVGSVPIIRLWDILLVPLQGEISDDIAERLSEQVLHKIQDERVTGLIIDVTGLWVLDSHLCSVISKLAHAAAVMGTRTYLCGMAPPIALTLQTMGLSLDLIHKTLSLERALEELGVAPPQNVDDDIDLKDLL